MEQLRKRSQTWVLRISDEEAGFDGCADCAMEIMATIQVAQNGRVTNGARRIAVDDSIAIVNSQPSSQAVASRVEEERAGENGNGSGPSGRNVEADNAARAGNPPANTFNAWKFIRPSPALIRSANKRHNNLVLAAQGLDWIISHQ